MHDTTCNTQPIHSAVITTDSFEEQTDLAYKEHS